MPRTRSIRPAGGLSEHRARRQLESQQHDPTPLVATQNIEPIGSP
ncbi:TPA: hypothetical protein ACNV5A_003801 [Aeromonas hydrophila]